VYNILIGFGIPMKLVRLIKMCLNEMFSRVHIDKRLADSFPIQNDLKQGDAVSPLISTLLQNIPLRNSTETWLNENWLRHISVWFMSLT
jgi:hypothetical protein